MRRGLVLAAISAGALLAAPAVASAEAGLTAGPTFNWKGPTNENEFAGPEALAATGSGSDIFAVGQISGGEPGHPLPSVVRRYSALGGLLSAVRLSAEPSIIIGAAASPSGDVVYVAAPDVGVLRVDPGSGSTLGSFAAPRSGPGALAVVTSVDVAPDGMVYVQGWVDDGLTSLRVSIFSPTGAFQGQFDPPGQQAFVHSGDVVVSGVVAIDPRDASLLYLSPIACEHGSYDRVDRYPTAGGQVEPVTLGDHARESFGLPDATSDVTIRSDGSIYTDTETRTSAVVSAFTEHGALIGSLAVPSAYRSGLALSSDGSRLWRFTDLDSQTVQSFASVAPGATSAAALPAGCPIEEGPLITVPGTTAPPTTTTAVVPAPATPTTTPAPFSLAKESALARGVVAKLKLGALAGKGYSRKFTADRAGTVVEEILVKKKVVARGTVTFTAAGAKSLKVKPTSAARKALKGKKVKLQVRTTFKPAKGALVVTTKTVTVKR